MNFSVNQATQVYVAGTNVSVGTGLLGADVKTTMISKTPDGKHVYLRHRGVDGKVSRSDLICIDNIESIVVTPADNIKLERDLFRLNPVYANMAATDAPIDYIVKVVVNNFIGMSVADSQFYKFGAVRRTYGMSKSDFLKAMALSLAKSAGREESPLFNVYLSDSASATSTSGATQVTNATSASTLTGTYASVLIEEATPDWALGTKQQKRMPLDVIPEDASLWNDVNANTGKMSAVGTLATTNYNGRLTADYEYFHMGERADQYRLMGWPDYVPTKYLVDPTKDYDYMNIHYSYTGSNESVQKSEKDITLLVEKGNLVAVGTRVLLGNIANYLNLPIAVAGSTTVNPS